jgi:micrococcal nuclease
LLFESCSQQKSSENLNQNSNYQIKKYIDGDTFWVHNPNGKDFKVRLIGINAPEPRAYFDKVEEPFGKEASIHIKMLLKDSIVRLEFDVDSLDQYGRTLAYVFLEDSTFINAKMIEDGYAQIATYPPNIKYVELYQRLEREARENERGLWAEDDVE